ncbi:hypothetical protein T4B_13302 [Trichinella pseudospiralis]|uniref:Uncharacterized protein n=1 Tax=Trichinella pseudospiralis TaxID=6337 RepID=A0A0V1DVU2_TRIPS|nr:hypothetical protein T4A_3417 [Trichinella pseudospiralis]KRY68571.1 hypothetical protein T4A_5771 [Trichinella pseudospiralis]KRZ12861.1 hypothetical protein T4B_13784 [Trichinella pseudospiralis]KRZ27431.1 hypothetical protein T4B_13302 [Trichinella pseudospiralis]KRZ34857.1 hypothetical protein T4C_9952 [Trichinella pseudospiralis]
MDSKENNQERSAPKRLRLDDHQLDVQEKQVKPNDKLEETKQIEQAMETDAIKVIETDSERSVTGSGGCSMGGEKMEDRECVMNINADLVNEDVFEGLPDGNGQSRRQHETPVMYDAANETNNEEADENLDAAQTEILDHRTDCDCEICRLDTTSLLLNTIQELLCFVELFAQYLQIWFELSLMCEECENL